MSRRTIAVPARMPGGVDGDPRVAGARRIFHDVVEALRTFDLDPVVVTTTAIRLEEFDGLVLPGGGDLDPSLYGGTPCAAVYDVNPEQDRLDLELGRRAIALDLPVLGICRGAQVLNVAAGGTLFEDLSPSSVEHRATLGPDGAAEFSWHEVDIDPSSALHEALGLSKLNVASGHHQGIDRLGRGFRRTASAADGLTEAFENETGRQLGVQWHPEAAGMEQHAPFIAFARAVTGLMPSRSGALS